MTIRARNRLFLFLFIASLLYCLFNVTLFVISAVKGTLSEPERIVRPLILFGRFFPYRSTATLAGIIMACVYVPVTMAFLYFSFEKTQSQEVIYFAAYLIGCMCESSRLLMPVSGMWRTTSLQLILVGRVVLAGRILAPLSLLFASLFSGMDQRQFVERNFVILFLLAGVIALIYPIDTMYTTSTYIVQYGYSMLFNVIEVLVFLSTLFTLIIQTLLNPSAEQTKLCIGYIIMIAGYGCITRTDNFVYLGLSLVFLPLGTTLYLKGIHSQYLWR